MVEVSAVETECSLPRESKETISVVKDNEQVRESLLPESSRPLGSESHFTWGADLGASIDLGGDDLSTFDIDAVLGYKNSLIRIIGVGAGIYRSFGNGNNFIPVYAIFRTSFRKKPSPLFFNLKVGYSFNTVSDSPAKGGFNTSIGLGINLAMSKRFMSHIIISYGYFRIDKNQALQANLNATHINQAQIRFGVNF